MLCYFGQERQMQEQITSFDLPVTEDITADQAAEQLNIIYADATGNKLHPYTNKQHPQHKQYAESVQKLHEIKTANQVNPFVKAANEALESQSQKVSHLVTEAKAEAKLLKRYGEDIDPDQISGDIQPYQVRLLKEHRLIYENDYMSVVQMFLQDAKTLNLPPEELSALRSIAELDLNPDLAEMLALDFLEYTHDLYRKKYKR
jgi:murein L,D-transpeptidase YcbB/YkuD